MAALRVLIVVTCVVAGSVSLCVAQGQPSGPEAGTWIVLQQGLDKDVPRYEIPLSGSDSRPGQFNSQPTERAFKPLDSSEKDFTHRVDFDPTGVGIQYSLLLRPAKEIEWLSQENIAANLFRVMILQGRNEMDLKTAKEGYVSMGQSFSLPVEVPGIQLGLSTKPSVRGSVDFRFDTMRPGIYRAFMTFNLNASLTGSVMTELVKLDATIEASGSKRLEDRLILIQVTPFDKRVRPDAAIGKTSDIINLPTSRVVVEKITPDYSKVGLAVVNGRLGERLPETPVVQPQSLTLQKPLPRFSRVDLIRRRLVSLDDLCSDAGEAGRIVMIFGDRPPDAAAYYGGSDGRPTAPLPLDEDLIQRMLSSSVQKPPILVFVSRRFDPATLYEKWLGKEPPFYVLSDFSQPLYSLMGRNQMAYRGMPGSPSQGETLRGKFALPEDKVSVLLIDGKGTVLYVEPGAQDKLERVLTGVNEMIRSLPPTSDPNRPAVTVPVPAGFPATRAATRD
jgi:hypothetical protein